MHRTQILLDKEQYMTLRELASRRGCSMAQLIRDFIDIGLSATMPQRKNRQKILMSMKGFIDKADVSGRDHDLVLYGDE